MIRRLSAPGLARIAWVAPLLAGSLAVAPPAAGEDFLVIFDTSGSMGTGAEIQPAKEALAEAIVEIDTPGARWGLRVYGSGCCSPDTELAVPLSTGGLAQIRRTLPDLRGTASSPMPAALAAARTGELAASGSWRQQAIVVSDGLVDREASCREARALREAGVRVTIIGLELAAEREGHETLRYVAEHPGCAYGRYIRADRPDLAGLALQRVAAAFHALPYRILGWLLALVAGYSITRFFELALERRTALPKHVIPPLCRAGYLLLAVASAGLFLGGATPGRTAAVAAVLAVLAGALYCGITFLQGASR